MLLESSEKPGKTPDPSALTNISDQLAFKARTVFLFGEVSDTSARNLVSQLIALNSESQAPITLIVSSPGGHVESGDAIHDMVTFIDAPVLMLGSGWVGSAATHLFLAAPKEHRFCLPNTRFLIHQPSGGFGGQGSDIAIQAKQMRLTKERIASVIAAATGKSPDTVLEDIDRDFWMSAKEAKTYGLICDIVQHSHELPFKD